MLPTSPAALAFANTLQPRTPTAQRPDAAQVLQHLAALTQLLTPWDLQALGVWANASVHCGTRHIRGAAGSGLPEGQLTVHESPAGTHRAFLWAPGQLPCCQAWVDGQAMDVPLQANGQPMSLMPGHWAGEDFYCLETIAYEPAPHLTPAAAQAELLTQRGLWVGQVSTGLHWQLAPRRDEHWPAPWARWIAGVGLRVWANSAVQDVEPVRECAL